MKLSFTKKIRVQIEDIIVKKGDLRQISHIALTIINRRRIPLPSAIYRHYNTVSEISDDMGDEGFLLEYIIPEPGKCLVDVGASVGGWTFIVAYTRSFGFGTATPASSDWYLIKTSTEFGLTQIDSSANSITLYRGTTDPYWNFVRVRIWKTT
jgi:hypothetical protein